MVNGEGLPLLPNNSVGTPNQLYPSLSPGIDHNFTAHYQVPNETLILRVPPEKNGTSGNQVQFSIGIPDYKTPTNSNRYNSR